MMRIGCSGWSYAHWQGRLYPSTLPASRWLERYAECFDTVEVNATFYRLPKRGTVARWAEITPDGFCFAVKGSRYLTHVRRLRDLPDGVARLAELLEPLSASGKLGPLLWQLPPTFRRDDERLATALAALPRGRQALEFRDPSWFTEDVYSLLREHEVALVVADRAGLPEAPWVEIRMAGAGSPQVTRRLVAALLDLRRVTLSERIEVLDEQLSLLRDATLEAMDDERDARRALEPDREGLGAEPSPCVRLR